MNSTIPRRFRMLEEYEISKRGEGDATISYGLSNPDDMQMLNWNGSIFGPYNTKFDGRIYELQIQTPQQYPQVAPVVKFVHKINLPSVGANGQVDSSKFNLLKNWNPSTTIEAILKGLQQEMLANKNTAQPAENTKY